jgi:hypothetical protein
LPVVWDIGASDPARRLPNLSPGVNLVRNLPLFEAFWKARRDQSEKMKPTTNPDSALGGLAAPVFWGRSVVAFAHGAILLAGIVSIGAALLLLGLLAWPVRLVRRQMGF